MKENGKGVELLTNQTALELSRKDKNLTLVESGKGNRTGLASGRKVEISTLFLKLQHFLNCIFLVLLFGA